MIEELREGGTNAEIAVRLGVSPDAIKFHISNMLAKLALDDRHQLAAWRPERERRRLLGTLALPVAFASLGRPLLWMGVALGGVAVLAVVTVVLLVATGDGDPEGNLAGAPPDTATPESSPEVTPAGPPVTFGDGTYRVGPDIPPGRYRANAPSEDCEWQRLRSPDSEAADASEHEVIGEGGHFMSFADIAPEDSLFVSRSCGTWSSDLSPRITPGQPFGDGTYLVGPEVAPGRYRTSPVTESCSWLRWSGFTGEAISDGDSGFGVDISYYGGVSEGTAIVDIEAGDAGFTSIGCGEWTTDLSPRVSPGEAFGGGAFLVGSEIAPGRYRAASSEQCYWVRLSGFGGDPSPVLFALGVNVTVSTIDFGVGQNIVDIAPSDVGFSSTSCGTWSPFEESAQAPRDSFGEGTFIVGSEVLPGRYRAVSPEQCRWERLRGFGGLANDQLAMGGGGEWDDGYSGAPETAPLTIVDIAPSDMGFSSEGCGTWSTNLALVATQKFGDGTYLVGAELSPGRYQASELEGCIWLRLSGFSGVEDDLLEAMDYGYGFSDRPPPAVEILPSDIGFFSSRCGTWRLLNPLGGSAVAGADAPPGKPPRVIPAYGRWFGDRVHEVGRYPGQVPFGLYRTLSSSAGCSWEVRQGGERFGNSGFAAAIVEILSRDNEFTSIGCGTWTDVLKQRVWPGEPFEDGAYFVGWEVAPGRYRASEPDSCSRVRLSSFRGFPAGEVPPVEQGGFVEIADSDAAFASQGCGTWTPVE